MRDTPADLEVIVEFILAFLALVLAVIAYFVPDHSHKLLVASVVLLSIAVLLGGDLAALSDTD